MQSQGGGVPESRYTMSYSHGALAGDGVDMYGHGPDSYVLHHQQHIGHGGQSGMSPTGHHNLGLGSPGQQHHQHTSSKRSADVAGLNLKQDPMVGDVTMSTIGMGHSTMVDEGSVAVANSGGQNGGSQTKKTPPPNGKKTKGRVKIKMEFIDNKLRRYTTFSKRKTGIMKKAYELSTLTGTQVMLLVASETGHVYTFATRKLQPMITSEAGKALIQTCLNSPDPPSSSVDQRMSATGFEETELTYTLHDEDQKDSDSEGDGEDANSSEPASRSPSPAERSYSSEGSGEPPQQQQTVQAVQRASTSRSSTAAGAGRSGGGGEPSLAHQQPSVNGVRNSKTAASNLNAVNLTSSNLPVNLSGLTLPLLPRGVAATNNLASLLASASLPGLSSLLSGAAGLALQVAGQQGGTCSSSSSSTTTTTASKLNAESASRKNLPRLISLAHLGAALQQPPTGAAGAKDAASSAGNRGLLMVDANNDNSALNLQTNTTNAKDKRGGGGGNKSRTGGAAKKK